MSEDPHKLLDRWLKTREFLTVGKNVQRVDALDKVIGRAKYVEDYLFDRMVFAKLVRGKDAHALIRRIDIGKAKNIPGVLSILTAKDIPGVNQVGYSLPDQPLLAESKVRFHGEPLALVVAKKHRIAEEAAELVEVEYEPLPAILDPIEAMSSKVLVHEEHGSNIALTTKVRKGDVEQGFSKAEVIVENEFRTPYQDHAYMETEGAVALPSEDGVKVIGSIQYPHLSQMIVGRVLGLKLKQVAVLQATVGGGFGGKDDMGPLACAQAALAAFKLGRPAMITYSREDSLIAHCKRDPTVIKYKSGADSNGKLTAIEAKIVFDSGAYANRGPYTLWRATMHASGPYEVPNAKVDGYLVYTNKVFQGSFRGFGNPPIQLAAESNMDELARRLEMDPVEFRLKNALRPGSRTITNQLLDHSVGISEALSKLAKASGWAEKRKKIEKGKKRRGIGVGCGWHGISTSRGAPDWSNAIINVNKDGSITAHTGIVEMGQGTKTGHTQIVAEVLGVPPDYVSVECGTTVAPDTGATHASRGSSIGGIGLLIAAAKLRERIEKVSAKLLSCTPPEVRIQKGIAFSSVAPEKRITWQELVKKCYETGVEMSATGYFFLPKGTFDQEKGQGTAYPAFSYIANIAEVEVDMETGQVKLLKVWPALASGKIINPLLVEGQIEGAIAQGMGYTMMEDVMIGSDGAIRNPNFIDYVIPTSSDMPEVQKPIFIEDLFKYGPFGAKGVGEMALIPTPSAIANAIFHATGVRIKELPITPDKLHLALAKATEGERGG